MNREETWLKIRVGVVAADGQFRPSSAVVGKGHQGCVDEANKGKRATALRRNGFFVSVKF